MSPVLGAVPKSEAPAPAPASLLDLRSVNLVSQGRAAITLALKRHRIERGDEVLLPAFNCPAMTAGIAASGAACRYFPIREDLKIDPETVLGAGTGRTKAVLVPHLFTRRQPKSLFDALRASVPWLLIEDCAHSFFGADAQDAIGSDGDLAIGSIAKFFPSRWGGVLASNRQAVDLPLSSPGATWQLKLLANSLEEAARCGTLGRLSPAVVRMLEWVTASRRGFRRAPLKAAEVAAIEDQIDLAFSEVDFGRLNDRAGWWVDLAIGSRKHFARRAARRRAVYGRLYSGLQNMSQGRLLQGSLTPDFPPYVLPLLLANPRRQFPMLRVRGVPLYRWEFSADGVCGVTDWYRESLVQLPCHDSMADETCDALIAAVRSVLDV